MGVDLPATPGSLTAVLAVLLSGGLANPPAASAAVLKVNTTRDEMAARDGRCSLREAIAGVDSPGLRTDCGTARRASNTIKLRSGRYLLSITPAAGDDNSSGDLDVTASGRLRIIGAGTRATVIDASRLSDRVLSVASPATVELQSLSLTGGRPAGAAAGRAGTADASCAADGAGAPGQDAGEAGSGGGIFNRGALELEAVAVIENRAAPGGNGGAGGSQSATGGCSGGSGGQGGNGGGVYNGGRLTVTDSTLRGNVAGDGGAAGPGGGSSSAAGGASGTGGAGGSGGAIYNQGSLSVSRSTMDENLAGPGGVGSGAGAGLGLPGADGGGGAGGWGGAIFSSQGRWNASDSTLVANSAGRGGGGGGLAGSGGTGGNGGAVALTGGGGNLRNATVAENAVGTGGAGASSAERPGTSGLGGGIFAQSVTPGHGMTLQNTVVASSRGSGCAGSTSAAIANGGHDLSSGDQTCPGIHGNPKLGRLKDNGGPTQTMALGRGSAAINRVPRRGAGCSSTDQRGVHRPQGRACDIGAYEFALPTITIVAPSPSASYFRGSRVAARFHCEEGGITTAIASCRGSVRVGHPLGTGRVGSQRFVVVATDKSGNRVRKSVRYVVFQYVNPVREVSGLTSRRIDLGVDYAGSGPLLAVGDGVVTMASDTDDGPSSCWAISCWPGGGIVVYRLLYGPFAGKYVYVAEHITVTVRAGERISAGQQIATLYPGYPWSEFGWAAGPGPEALGIADGHACPCGDPGGWSTIDGRDFNHLLVRVGAPSGLLQSTPNQSMPRGWPSW